MSATPKIQLQYATSDVWTQTVLNDFAVFLNDHASAEKKASSMAMTMISHYPDRTELVNVMTELAVEELSHFKEVVKLIHSRNEVLGTDRKDAYVNALIKHFRKGSDIYLLDRLLIAGIIEARGAERFGLIAAALPTGHTQQFYRAITQSEQRHHQVFIELACLYFSANQIDERLQELLAIEADICAALPLQAALH